MGARCRCEQLREALAKCEGRLGQALEQVVTLHASTVLCAFIFLQLSRSSGLTVIDKHSSQVSSESAPLHQPLHPAAAPADIQVVVDCRHRIVHEAAAPADIQVVVDCRHRIRHECV